MGPSIAWALEKDFPHHPSVPFIGLAPPPFTFTLSQKRFFSPSIRPLYWAASPSFHFHTFTFTLSHFLRKKIFPTIHPSPLLGWLPRGAEAVVRINLCTSATFLLFSFLYHQPRYITSANFHTFLFIVGNIGVHWTQVPSGIGNVLFHWYVNHATG